MKRLIPLIFFMAFCASAKTPKPPTLPYAVKSNPCGQVLNSTSSIFCYVFDAPMGVAGTRTGDLDPNVWGVSRGLGQGINFGQQWYGVWNATPIQKCDGSTPTVNAPASVIICNGQLRDAIDDNNAGCFDCGDVAVQAMYPKQQFSFAGRTGTVSFDVSNNGAPHGAWPEFWMSDLPVPAPFNHFDTWQSIPQNGFGLRFDSYAAIGQNGQCPNNNNLTKLRWTVESAAIVRNYVLEDTLGFGVSTGTTVTQLDCVVSSPGPGSGPMQMNHVEIRISQSQIDVYAWDAGVIPTTANQHHIAVVTGANLSFSAGLVWLEDVHYNGDKELDPTRPSFRINTFTWDNLAFDGPFTHRDFTFDAPDQTTPGPNGATILGQFAPGGGYSTWTITGLPATRNPAAAVVLFNFAYTNGPSPPPTVLNVIVNGNAVVATPWPFSDNGTSPQGNQLTAWRTLAVPVPLSNLVTGTNTVQIGADIQLAVMDVDIALANVPGGVPVLPGSNNAYPGN